MSSLEKFSFKSALNRIISAYSFDSKKYDRKGFGKYVGYLLLVSYFTLLPKLFEAILPYLLDTLPHKLIMGTGILFINVFILLCYNTIMIFIYKAKHPFFEKYRINPKPWPWEQNYEQWIKLLKKSLKTVFLNSVIIGGILSLHDSWTSLYKYSLQEIPDTSTIVWQFFFFLFMEDLFFYIGHSTLHRPQFYWIHKKHHEYGNTVTIAAEYAHPIQHVFGNALPTFIGYKILSNVYPVHVITIWVYLAFRIVQTCDGHSGYEWSWAQSQLLPFSAGSAYHNFHHSHNVGNYGSFFKIWDSIFGTNTDYINYRTKVLSKNQAIYDTPIPRQNDNQKKE